MSHRDLIKHFMREKSSCVYDKTKIALYWKADYTDINRLTNFEIKMTIDGLRRLTVEEFIDDGDCCPQCISSYNVTCTDCNYGKRHGACDEGSKYSKIVSKNDEEITVMIGQDTLKKYFKYNFNTQL